MMELMWFGYRFSGRCEHEQSVFDMPSADQPLYLSKKPPDTTRIERVFRADRALHVIAMLRDPRAVMTSKHPSRPDVYFSDYHRWREYVAALEPLQNHPRWLVVRYEDLITNPNFEQQRIEERFGFLERRRKFSEFPQGTTVPERAQRSLGGVRPFDTSRIHGWHQHLSRVKGQLLEHPDLPNMLVQTGYERDATWTASLDAAEPYSQRYKDGGPGALRRLETDLRYALKTSRYLRRLKSRRAQG